MSRVWIGGSLTGFHTGFRWRGGSIHFGVKLFCDRPGSHGYVWGGNLCGLGLGAAWWYRP